jgi:hypothetical protein
MAILEEKQTALRKFVLPTAAGALGAGAGLFLTRKRNARGATPSFGDLGIASLADDLRGRVESVLHKADPSMRVRSAFESAGSGRLDSGQLEKRRHEREQRRNRRRARS